MLLQNEVLFALIVLVSGTKDDEEVSFMTKDFADAIGKCQLEMNFGEHAIDDFSKYWNSHDLETRGVGCIIMCFAKQMGLQGMGAVFRKENVTSFVKQLKAGEKMAGKFSELYKRCLNMARAINNGDECQQGLELARCFRYGVFELKSALRDNHRIENKTSQPQGGVKLMQPGGQPQSGYPGQYDSNHPALLGNGYAEFGYPVQPWGDYQWHPDGACPDQLHNYPFQYDGSYPSQPGYGYSNQPGASYPGQPMNGYSGRTGGGSAGQQVVNYPGQQGVNYLGQRNSGSSSLSVGGYKGQQAGGIPGHYNNGYLGQFLGSYPSQLRVGYPAHLGSGYPGQLGVGYAGQYSGGYPGQVGGKYPGQWQGNYVW